MSSTHHNAEQTINYAALPFVSSANGITNFWAVTSTGHWNSDTDLGEMYAVQAVNHMRREETPFLLRHVVEAMRGKEFGGIETGFLSAIAILAVAGQR